MTNAQGHRVAICFLHSPFYETVPSNLVFPPKIFGLYFFYLKVHPRIAIKLVKETSMERFFKGHEFYDLNLVSELCTQETILRKRSSINIRHSQYIQSRLKQIIRYVFLFTYFCKHYLLMN